MPFRTPLATVLILAGIAATVVSAVDAAEPKPPARIAAASQPAVRRDRAAPVDGGRTLSPSEAQALVDAPISRNYVPSKFLSRYGQPRNWQPRNYGPTDVGGRGTATGRGISQVPDEPLTTTTLYGGYSSYFSPLGFGYGYGGWSGPGGLYGFGYAAPFQTVFAGYGAYAGIGGPVGFPLGIRSSFYWPRYFAPVYSPYYAYGSPYFSPYYSYGVYGYPYYSYLRPTPGYLPSYSYFMYPGVGGLYVPPGYFGFPSYFGYGGYGIPSGYYGYGGAFYW